MIAGSSFPFLRRTLLLSFLLISGSACSFGGGAKPGFPARPEGLVKDRVTFTPDRPEQWTLPNGLKVYYRRDDELPSVRAQLYFPGGTLFVSKDQAGLADATGVMLREGAFTGMSPDALDKALDDLAAGIESGYGQIYGSVGWSSLKEDFATVTGFASEIVQHPAFDDSRFQLWKRNTHQAIDRRKDNPAVMSNMLIGGLVYGADSPYAAPATHQTISAISREDLREFYRKYAQPKGARLVVTGDITRDELTSLIEKTFAKWTPSPGVVEAPPIPPGPELGKPGIYVLERDFDQSTVVMAHVGPPLPHPQIPEMGVFNRLYGGGGFGNVLMQQIRTKEGLAYSVGGAISPGIGAGLVTIELATRNDEAIRAIQKVLEVTKDALAHPMPAEEVDGAKSAVQRAFIFRFESPDQVAARVVQQDMLHFPPDYDATYLSKVEAMTPARALSVGQEWVKPEHLVISIIGRVSAEKIAEAFGPQGIPVYRVTFDELPRIAGEVAKR